MELITRKEAARRASVSISTLKRLEADGDFPARVPISANRVAYSVAELEQWIGRRIAERDEAAVAGAKQTAATSPGKNFAAAVDGKSTDLPKIRQAGID